MNEHVEIKVVWRNFVSVSKYSQVMGKLVY